MFVRICNSFYPAFNTQEKFPADINICAACANSIAGDDDTLDHLMWVAFNNLAVFEGARFAFIGVNRHDFLEAGIFGHETPFYPGWKSRPAPAAETGPIHLLD